MPESTPKALRRDCGEPWNAEEQRIKNVGAPVTDDDAASKGYCDANVVTGPTGPVGPTSSATGPTGTTGPSGPGLATDQFGLPPGAAAHQPDGGANNCDSYFAEYNAADKEEYVRVESLAADQDLDIVYQLQVPWDFASWDTNAALKLTYKVDDGVNAGVTVYVYDTDGNLDFTSARGQSVSAADITMTAANLDGTYTPGANFVLVVKADGDANDNIYVGKVRAKYNRS